MSDVCARYSRGNLLLTVRTVCDDSGDVVVSLIQHDEPPTFTCYRVQGWVFAQYVIEHMFTLD